jgi:hypothetical protein
MLKSSVKLKNADGSHRMTISLPEAQRLEREGKARRISKPKAAAVVYQMTAVAVASDSHESPAMLTMADLEAVAGIRKLTDQRRERLIGWGLMKEKIADFASGVRAMHFAEPEAQVAQ